MRGIIALLLGGMLAPAASETRLWFFLQQECPISKYYAPEVERICQEYAAAGVGCTAVFIDRRLSDEDARRHGRELGLKQVEIRTDPRGEMAKAAGATVTPEAVVLDAAGKVLYRGRIDNYFFGWGRRRGAVTERDLRNALTVALRQQPVQQPWPKAIGCYIETTGEQK